METLTTVSETASLLSKDLIMTGILLFIWLCTTLYLVKVIKAIVKDHKAQIIDLTAKHNTEIKELNDRLLEVVREGQALSRDLISIIKETNETITFITGVLFRIEEKINNLKDK